MESFFHRWKPRNKTEQNINFSSRHSLILQKILASRGLIEKKDVELFLNPSIKYLHDPFLLPNMDAAVKRLIKGIIGKEKILIFGDYDADGVISSIIIYNFLNDLNLDPEVYIPSRFEEGYDISLDFVKKIENDKHDLIICVDCGTNSLEVQDYKKKNKYLPDFIICDHHEPAEGLEKYKQDKYIIVNPKLSHSKYPFRDLSGGGVTFKLIIAALRKASKDIKKKFNKSYLNQLLDLVAISTIADVMPLLDENRIIVKNGLRLMKKTKNKGLKKIIENVLGKGKEINAYDVGFIIAPRLNSAGRIDNASSSIELLKNGCTDIDEKICKLNGFNQQRKKIQQDIFEEIKRNVDLEKIIDNNKIYIGKSKNWNEGVLGIVASKIVKEYNIPAILFKEKENSLKGSGRSIRNFNMYKNLTLVDEYFLKYGGHELACGITMEKEKYDSFKEKLIEIARKNISNEDIKKKLYYDIEINFGQINNKLLKEIKLLEPFGTGNPKPVFLTKNCFIKDIRILKNGRHIKFVLENEDKRHDAIMFEVDKEIKNIIYKGNDISILYYIQENEWMGNKSIQLVIIDLF